MRPHVITLALAATLLASSALFAQDKNCRETRNPKHLPAANEVVDSAAALAALAQSNTLAADMRFSLLLVASSPLPHVRPLEGTETAAAATLMRALRPQKPGDTWAVRVHISGGASPSLTIERSIFCPPQPLADMSAGPRRVDVRVRAGDVIPMTDRPIRVRIEALIDEDGMPTNVRVTQSTGIADLDDETLRLWEQRRFHPALLDGQPIQALFRTDGESPRM
jgi:TonB family protein